MLDVAVAVHRTPMLCVVVPVTELVTVTKAGVMVVVIVVL